MSLQDRPASSGRRDNGLTAQSWVTLAEVDPRQVADLLAALAAAGIAAYTIPSPGLVGGFVETRLPARPVSRLHVDASRRQDAEAVVRAELMGMFPPDEPDAQVDASLLPPAIPVAADAPAESEGRTSSLSAEDDAAFAAIVAGWDAELDFEVNPWPVSEDAGPDPAAPTVNLKPEVVSSYPLAAKPPYRPAADDEHYVPPPPPPLPRIPLKTAVSILAVLVGTAILITVSVIGVGDQLPLVGGVLLIIAGVAGLLAGMRDHDDHDGWDDGAVV